jgi:hypothetical protein
VEEAWAEAVEAAKLHLNFALRDRELFENAIRRKVKL